MRVKRWKALPWLAACALVIGGCGGEGITVPADDGGLVDSGTPDGGTPDGGMDFFAPGGDGASNPLSVPGGSARAGRLGAADLPPDPNGLSVVKTGDFVLANDKIAVVIEDAGPSDLYDPYGGAIIDVGRMEGGKIVDPADFNELMVGVGRFLIEPTSVSVVADGTAGGPAVVRAIGTLQVIPFINSFGAALYPSDYTGFPVAVDYVLEPGASFVDAYYTFDNTGGAMRQGVDQLFLVMQFDRMPIFSPDYGFSLGMGVAVPHPWIGYTKDGLTGWAIAAPAGMLAQGITVSGTNQLIGPKFDIPAGEILRRHYMRFYAGGPGADGLQAAIRGARNEPTRALSGVVQTPSGDPLEGIHVHVESADGSKYVTRSEPTGADGVYTVHVPDGEAVRLTPYVRGADVPAPTAVAADATAGPDLTLTPPAFLKVEAHPMGAPTEPLPIRLKVISTTGSIPTVPDYFGEQSFPNAIADTQPVLHLLFPLDGRATVPVPTGTYRVVASHGPEYSVFDDGMVEVDAATDTPDSPKTLNIALEHLVDSPGVLCGDFHIHTFRSPDSGDDAKDKIRSGVADGNEIMVRSDHEWVNDFDPIVKDLGAQAWVYGVSGIELTTFVFGHFGVFPLVADPSQINDGSIPWNDHATIFNPVDVLNDARSRPGSPLVIINHPRWSGGIGGAYFNYVGYDRTTGDVSADKLDQWDTQFQVVEVFNDQSFNENLNLEVGDWFSFLSRGRHIFAVGDSDSHHVFSGSPVGYPRNCITLGTDEPEAFRQPASGIDDDTLRDAVRDGHLVVSGGVYVTVTGPNGEGPGDTVKGAGANVTLHVKVQSPPWTRFDAANNTTHDVALEMFANCPGTDGRMCTGGAYMEIPVGDVMDQTTWFDGDVTVPTGLDGTRAEGWVVFHAYVKDGTLDPVFASHGGAPREPFGVTNPIFFKP